jgi:hypothetical protein
LFLTTILATALSFCGAGWADDLSDCQNRSITAACRRAANQLNGQAQLILAQKYALGDGVPEDKVQAYKWFTLAYITLVGFNGLSGDEAIRMRDALAATMTPAEIAEGKRLAAAWTPKNP